MADTNQNGTGTSDVNLEPKQQIETELSNRDVKSHPLFQKVASEAAELRKFKEAQEAADTERARKTAEAEQNYEKAKQFAIVEARKSWETEQSTKDARSEARFQLVKIGFKNERFINGLLGEFDPAKVSAEEFARAAASDKENALFLESVIGKKTAPNPDPQSPPAGRQGRLTDEEIANLKISPKPEDRFLAYEAARAKWREENKGKVV